MIPIKKLVLLTFVIWFMLAVSTALARVIVVSKPLPASLRTVKADVCEMPCWIGINPGITTVDDARELIKQSFPMTSSETISPYVDTHHANLIAPNLYERQTVVSRRIEQRLHSSYTLNHFMIMFSASTAFNVHLYSKQEIVQQIEFSFEPDLGIFPSFTPTLGEVVETYGLPKCVSFYAGSGVAILSLNYLNKMEASYREFQFLLRSSRQALEDTSNPPLFRFRSNGNATCPYTGWLDLVLLARYLLG